MTDKENVGNAISGRVAGSVVQAGTIGQVVLPPAHPEPLPVPRQLPPAMRDFTGRDHQLAALDALLPDSEYNASVIGVAVVDGAGGGGKTTTVVYWAHQAQDRFPDGTLFANLRGYGPSNPLDPLMALSSFLPALGVAESHIPADVDAQAGLYRSVLASKRVLIVLDNASDAGQVRPLLPGTPGCLVVVTSRNSLTELVVAEAAHRFGLDPFTPAESHALLRRILGPARVDAEPEAVTELVRVCAGLPLAVRVAATRAAARPQLGLSDVVADITEDHGRGYKDSFGGSGDVGDAVRSVFDWSYTRLSAEQAKVFRRLGLHPSQEFGVHAAAALTRLDLLTVYRCLETLAELHLVEPVSRKRYRMHDLLHAYAAHRSELDETSVDRHDAVTRVLAWYARTAQRADRAVYPLLAGMPGEVHSVEEELSFADRVQALAWLRTEHTNLVAATRFAVEGQQQELAVALATSCRFLSYRERVMATLHIEVTSLGLSATRTMGNHAVEALLLTSRAETQVYLGNLADAEADFASTLTLADAVDDRFFLFLGLIGLGQVRFHSDRLHDAREYYQRALLPAQELGGGRSEAVVHANLSQISTRLGEFEQALDHAKQELVLRRRAGDQTGVAFALYDAALARQGLGEHATAIGLCREAVAIYRASDDIGDDLVQAILTLATSLEYAGHLAEAAVSLREALTVLTRLDNPQAERTHQRLIALESRIGNEPPR
ncbi:tetratricopeptide repeat protein [Amycolatopsis sp. H20-H5]|uniref:tetratricopeptide repeat protein n=1 Tax=Amycolatopsis sp. H20-H5 TaxID=3046309 RepID=UPI002DBAC62C|nr:tetratricopeptide repeat protein [Amycolatopsis sp. H20-H5]MEC3979887.1 tetratricopeptide repeat protein [Amycolatopsis sp. H20-H5]